MTGIELAAWRSRKKIKKKADQVAVMIARLLCMMMMPSDGCALEMTLLKVGSIHMSMPSQSSVYAACALEGGEMMPKRSHRLPVIRRRSRDVVKVGGHSIHLSLAGKIGEVIVIVAVFLGEDVERRVEAEEVAVVI
eukprot:2528493-Pleurochrysis_carterae.AAC.1